MLMVFRVVAALSAGNKKLVLDDLSADIWPVTPQPSGSNMVETAPRDPTARLHSFPDCRSDCDDDSQAKKKNRRTELPPCVCANRLNQEPFERRGVSTRPCPELHRPRDTAANLQIAS